MAKAAPAASIAMLRMWFATGGSIEGQLKRFTERLSAVIGLQTIHSLPTRQRLAVQAAQSGYLSALRDLEAANVLLDRTLAQIEELSQ